MQFFSIVAAGWLLAATTGTPIDRSSAGSNAAALDVISSRLARRSDDIRLTVSLEAFKLDGKSYGYAYTWPVYLGANGERQGPFNILFDTGSNLFWVKSKGMAAQKGEGLFQPPSNFDTDQCPEPVVYGSGSLHLKGPLHTTVTMGTRWGSSLSMQEAPIRLGTDLLEGGFDGYNGIIGMSPKGAADVIAMLGAASEPRWPDTVTQFLFDGDDGTLQFGSFEIDDDSWSNVEAQGHDSWIMPDVSEVPSDDGNILIDTGNTHIKARPDRIQKYFDKWPEHIRPRHVKDGWLIPCDYQTKKDEQGLRTDISQLPDFEIKLNEKSFDIPATDLIGSFHFYEETDDQNQDWCTTGLADVGNYGFKVDTILG